MIAQAVRRCLIRAILAPVLLAMIAAAPGPAERFGPLFAAVQQARIFADGKTFADAEPLDSAAAIAARYATEQPRTDAALRAFVLRNFRLPDASANPGLREHIQALWPQLTRPPLTVSAEGSALPLPAAYVVPGGRFRELYYWDSYFTMLGLRADHRDELVETMLDDFTSLIERYGLIPNGTRTYYLSRSQPPFFAAMVALSKSHDSAVARHRLAALRAEYRFWMRGAACAGRTGACEHVVRMPDGALLNRYWDMKAAPRDESFAEDVATAAASSRPAAEVYRDLRAAAESGWDFSSRWLASADTLASIRTTSIVPVDLNSLLWLLERTIAVRCAEVDPACARTFRAKASDRATAMHRYLWDEGGGWFADWDVAARRHGTVLSAATVYPLFAGLASPHEAAMVAANVRTALLADGGLRTTGIRTGQQWDAPNGWAPLQWLAVEGLARYGHAALARDIARRWIATVDRTYRDTGKLLEKYDVEEQRPGGGGEYPLQDGFGWTNGVVSALLDRFPYLEPRASPH